MMTSSREIVLGRIRSALGTPSAAQDAQVAQWAQAAQRWTRPKLDGDIVQRFIAKAQLNHSEVHAVSHREALVPAVDAILQAAGVAERNVSMTPALRRLGWPADWSIHCGKGRISERVSVTEALAGVAETGSLVFASSAEQPTSLNFLPDIHFAVLQQPDIVAHFEDVWPRLRTLSPWPRAVNVISAPSRTADVAQIVVRPAHGPKQLHILLVKSA